MDSTARVYEQTTVIHELTQGIEMAKLLRLNLNSSEAREFLIQKILSSYDKALFLLKSGGQPQASTLPESSLPKSSISTGSPQRGEFEFKFDQNVISRKRKLSSTPWEDEVRILNDNELEGNTNDGYSWTKYGQKNILGAKFPRSYYKCSNNKFQKCMATKQVKRTDGNPIAFEVTYKGIHTCNSVAELAPPPPSPEKHETKPTHHHLYHELSTPNPSEILSNLRTNLGVDAWGLDAILPSSFSFPPTVPFGFSDDGFQPLPLPNHLDDELLQGYSPPFISPATSESNYITDGGSSSSLDFLTDPVDLYPDFEFHNSFL